MGLKWAQNNLFLLKKEKHISFITHYILCIFPFKGLKNCKTCLLLCNLSKTIPLFNKDWNMQMRLMAFYQFFSAHASASRTCNLALVFYCVFFVFLFFYFFFIFFIFFIFFLFFFWFRMNSSIQIEE